LGLDDIVALDKVRRYHLLALSTIQNSVSILHCTIYCGGLV
jgi:hypothetical protein